MRRMLIVDDERDICECLETFFTGRGFSVHCAYSGEEALTQLQDSPADVILLDIILPGVSGLEVLKRVKKLYPGARIIMVTGRDEIDLRAEAKLFGAADYVTKPFDFSPQTWSKALSGSR